MRCFFCVSCQNITLYRLGKLRLAEQLQEAHIGANLVRPLQPPHKPRADNIRLCTIMSICNIKIVCLTAFFHTNPDLSISVRRKTATVILSHCGCKRFCISAFLRDTFYCAKKRSKIEPPELLPEEVTSLSFEVEKVSSMRVPFGAFEPGSTDIETTTPSV